MKKLIAVILTLACAFGLCAVPASAFDEEEMLIISAIDMEVGEYYCTAALTDGFFAEGESPSMTAILYHVEGYLYFGYEDYLVDEENLIFELPAEEFEALVYSEFTESAAIAETLHASENYKTDKDAPYYLVQISEGYFDTTPTASIFGYEDLGNGVYVAYSYLTETEMGYEPEYTPEEGDVEGVDYVYMPAVWSESLMGDGIFGDEPMNFDISMGYVPAKLCGVLRSVVAFDGETYTATLSACEILEPESYPAEGDIESVENGGGEELESVVAMLLGAYVSLDDGALERGTVVTTTSIVTGEEYDAVAEALLGISEEFMVYNIEAEKGGEKAEANGVSATFAVAFELSEGERAALYLVGEDGSLTELEAELSILDEELGIGMLNTNLSLFGTFIVAKTAVEEGAPEGGEESDDTPVNTPDEDKEPEAAPETTPEAEKDEPAEDKPVQSPPTGDGAAAIIILLAVCTAGICVLLVSRKRSYR
ncbi:MAG: hypothetical protein IJ046_01760 [Clostridia bacterium]|nr:hypothetical protein [Clostridia bacterium]